MRERNRQVVMAFCHQVMGMSTGQCVQVAKRKGARHLHRVEGGGLSYGGAKPTGFLFYLADHVGSTGDDLTALEGLFSVKVLGCRIRLTSAGYRIDELVNRDKGWFITWEGLYSTREGAAAEVKRVRPDIDQDLLLASVLRQEG